MAHYEPPHQDLRCLQIQVFSSLVLKVNKENRQYSKYCISLVIRQWFSPSRTIPEIYIYLIFEDRSRILELFQKGKPHVIIEFHKTDLVIEMELTVL